MSLGYREHTDFAGILPSAAAMNSWMLKYCKLLISGSYVDNCLLCSALAGILIQSKHRFKTTFLLNGSLASCFYLLYFGFTASKNTQPCCYCWKDCWISVLSFLKLSRNNVNWIPLFKPLNSKGFPPFSESPCCFPSRFTFDCYPSPSSSLQSPLTTELLLVVPASPTCSYQ